MADGKVLVDAWLDDVSRAASDRDSLLDVLKSERRILEELERMPPSYQNKLGPTRARLMETIGQLEEREREHAAKVPEFMSLMEQLPDAIVARALVLRTTKGETWQRCAMKLHINRTHLERRYRKSLPDLVRLVPDRYKPGDASPDPQAYDIVRHTPDV